VARPGSSSSAIATLAGGAAALGQGPAFAMDMTYLAMADSIGMAMANAVASQQRAQTLGSAALAQVLTLILTQGAKSS
jgi:hypothetical protein